MESPVDLHRWFPFGLIPAVHTPLTRNGELNLPVVDKQAEYLSSQQLTGVFVAGTTGECHSLTLDERQRLTERWCDVTRGSKLSVMVHVGHNCQRDACQLASHAARCGASAIAATAPFYFKPQNVAELIDFLEPIGDHAREVPFYYYDIPSFTGVRLDMAHFLEAGKQRISNLAGLKFTNNDLVLMQQCVQLNQGEFHVLHGFDETLLAGVTLGARGAVGNTYNIAANLYRRLLTCWSQHKADEARDLQAQSVRLITTLQAFGFQASSKAALELVGIDCGPPRSPLPQLEATAKRQLFQRLEELQVIG